MRKFIKKAALIFALLWPGVTWAQFTYTVTSTVQKSNDYGIGINETTSFYDQDEVTLANPIAEAMEFEPTGYRVIETVTTGGTTTFTDSGGNENRGANWWSTYGATYSCNTAGHITVQKSSSITAYSVASNVVTLTVPNVVIAGTQIVVTATGTPFNGQTVTVLSTGLSNSQLQFNYTTANVSTTSISGSIATTLGNNVVNVTITYKAYGYTPNSTIPMYFVSQGTSGGGAIARGTIATDANGSLTTPIVMSTLGGGNPFTINATVPIVAAARSGTIAANTAMSGGHVTWTVNDAATALNNFTPGDFCFITARPIPTPQAWCSNGNGGQRMSLSGTASCNYNSTDLPTAFNDGAQTGELITGSSGSATYTMGLDAGRRRFLQLNGNYALTFLYKAKTGTPVFSANISRSGSADPSPLNVTQTLTASGSGWQQATIAFTGLNETVSTGYGNLILTLGTSTPNVDVYVDSVRWQKTSGLESANAPANAIFSDAYIDSLVKFYGGTGQVGGRVSYRMWNNVQMIADALSLINDDAATWTTAAGLAPYPVGAGNFTAGKTTNDFGQLVLAKQLQTLTGKSFCPELIVPDASSYAQAQYFTQYLFSTNLTSGGGLLRHQQGYDQPWFGSTGVFSCGKASLGNENWNDASFNGQNIGANSSFPSPQMPLGLYTSYVWGAVKADPTYQSGYLDLSITLQEGSSNDLGFNALAVCANCSAYEGAPYIGTGNNSSSPLNNTTAIPALITEAYQIYQSGGPMYNDIHNYANYIGSFDCTLYEFNVNAISNGFTSATQAAVQQFSGGLGNAIAQVENAAQATLNGCTGPKTMFTYGQWHFAGPAGTSSSMWGTTLDTAVEQKYRPVYLGASLYNQAVIGDLLVGTATGVPTYNFSHTGTWLPNDESNIPYLTFLPHHENGTSNYSILINNKSTSAQSGTFAGSLAPTGTVLVSTLTSSNMTDTAEDFGIDTITGTGGVVTVNLHHASGNAAEAVPFVVGDVISIANSTSLACNLSGATLTAVTLSTSASTLTFSNGSCTSATGGYVSYNTPVPTITTSTLLGVTAGQSFSIPMGITVLSYTTGGTPQAAAPTLSPAPGAYGPAQNVTPSSTTTGATYLYCTGVGCTPTTPVSTSIPVSTSETIGVLAQASGYLNSAVTYGAYAINGAVATPVISPATGSFPSAQTVTITDTTSGATIYYTLDGSTPTTASPVYSSSFLVSSTTTVKAIAVATGFSNSAVTTSVITINGAVPTPNITPTSAAYTSPQTVTITDSLSGATIYYTLDGSTPTTSSPLYTGSFTQSTNVTIKAIAVKTGYTNSAVASVSYTFSGGLCAPVNGTVTIKVSIVTGGMVAIGCSP